MTVDSPVPSIELQGSFVRRLLHVARSDKLATVGAAVFAAIVLVALFAPVFIDFDARAIDLGATFEPPGETTVLGRDHLGRDVLERVLIGARYSLSNGMGALAVALFIGVPLGLMSGYFRGKVDEVVMWAVEVLMALPGILLALLVVAIVGPNRRNVVLAVGFSAIPVFTRLARGSALAIREHEYVTASRVLGARSSRVMRRHVLPGAIPSITVTAVLSLGTMIITIAGLGFLGFGGDASIPEWGAMLREGLAYMQVAPWLILVPAGAILVTVLSLNLLGDGLADALDPAVLVTFDCQPVTASERKAILMRSTKKRPPRSRFLVLAPVLTLLLSAWSSGDYSAEAVAPDRAQVDEADIAESLTWAVPTAIEVLDPQASFSLTTGMAVGRNIFDRLVESDENLEIVPRLATDWEVSDDGLTWTFNLREGVEFHDGTPFNADAVVFSVERALDPEQGLVAGNFAWGGVSGIEKVDDYTVAIHTEAPVAALLTNIADGGLGSIISPTSVDEAGDFAEPIGTGAFRFVSWQPDGDLVLERNAGYWDTPPAYEQLVVTTSTEGSTRVNQLVAGEVDLISLVPIPELPRVEADENLVMMAEPATSWVYVSLNNSKPPFDDVAVRRAFNYAVDKEAIIENILGGLGRVPDSPIGSGYALHKSVMTYEFSPERANELLDEAGWVMGADGVREKAGTRLAATLRYGEGNIEQSDAIAQAIASQLQDVGADISIEAMEFSTFSEQNRLPQEENPIEMALERFGTGDPDTGMGSTLHSRSHPPAGNNTAFYSNPEVDEALDAGGSTFDTEERRPFYDRAQELVMADAPWIFVTERREAVAWQSYVSGVRFIPTSAGLIDVRSVTLDQ